MAATIKSTVKVFEGHLHRCSHISTVLGNVTANFSVFMPECSLENSTVKVPQIYFLSGLTCTDENFVTKAGAFKAANTLKIALIIPDTSPRDTHLEGEDDSYDFGSGAGFYVNATQVPWNKHYQMYDYVLKELPQVVESQFQLQPEHKSIMGHSMGGHGALVLALSNPTVYKSVSAFAPICNPTKCPWGIKAFSGYLGDNIEAWKAYDAVELVQGYKGPDLHIFIDQGSNDPFLIGNPNQLLPENFISACKQRDIPHEYFLREGYDHSYFYISTFIADHIAHHAKFLFN